MRLDKYLKVSRLIKRRTVANEACDNERVSVNGRVVRASYDVKVGDKITIRFGQKELTVEVLDVSMVLCPIQCCFVIVIPVSSLNSLIEVFSAVSPSSILPPGIS